MYENLYAINQKYAGATISSVIIQYNSVFVTWKQG